MYTDAPICTRCCFCIPLRYGLLVWGYIKMVPLIFIGGIIVINIVESIIRHSTFRGYLYVQIFSAAVILLDFIFNIVLLIAAHKKSYKMFKIYYQYNIGEFILFCVLTFIDLFEKLYYMLHGTYYLRSHTLLHYYTQMIMLEAALLLICFYIVLLVRSELKKLENENVACNFVNNAADAHCAIVQDEPKDVVVA